MITNWLQLQRIHIYIHVSANIYITNSLPQKRGAFSGFSEVGQSFLWGAWFEIARRIGQILHKIGKSRVIKNVVQYFTSLNFFHRHVILQRIFFNVCWNCRFFFLLKNLAKLIRESIAKISANFFKRLWKNIVNFFKYVKNK